MARVPTRTLLIGLAVAAALIHCWVFRDFTVDDAAISYNYARRFAAGHGLVYFPGGERVEGYSNFLWVVLLGCGAALGANVLVLSKVLGAALVAGTVVLAAELLAALRGSRSPVDAVPAFLVAALTPIAYFGMSGLENGLYIALLTGCALTTVRELSRPGAFPWSAILAAALAMTRPDGALLFCIAAALRVLGSLRVRDLALWAAVGGLPVLAHLLWRHSYYGAWVPNTYYEKGNLGLQPLPDLWHLDSPGWQYVMKMVREYWLWPLVAAALLAFVRRGRIAPRLAVVALIGGVVFFTVYSRGDWMSEARFCMPLLRSSASSPSTAVSVPPSS